MIESFLIDQQGSINYEKTPRLVFFRVFCDFLQSGYSLEFPIILKIPQSLQQIRFPPAMKHRRKITFKLTYTQCLTHWTSLSCRLTLTLKPMAVFFNSGSFNLGRLLAKILCKNFKFLYFQVSNFESLLFSSLCPMVTLKFPLNIYWR